MDMAEVDALGRVIQLNRDSNKPTWLQPMKLTSNVRLMSRMDYQPDVCKDYKETGYCGFGDSCKFLHDRTDYKQSWQLDKEFEEKQKQKNAQNNADNNDTTNQNGEDLPFACLICRNPFVNPVKTACAHYFCESCALKEFRKKTTCFACKKETQGIFTRAVEIENAMKTRKRKTEELGEESENEKGNEANVMFNSDVARLINSDEVQSKVRPAIKTVVRAPLKKNPLTNLGARVKLNPYALALRRSEVLAEQRRNAARAAAKSAKRTAAPVNKADVKTHAPFKAANEARLLGDHTLPEAIAKRVAEAQAAKPAAKKVAKK